MIPVPRVLQAEDKQTQQKEHTVYDVCSIHTSGLGYMESVLTRSKISAMQRHYVYLVLPSIREHGHVGLGIYFLI